MILRQYRSLLKKKKKAQRKLKVIRKELEKSRVKVHRRQRGRRNE